MKVLRLKAGLKWVALVLAAAAAVKCVTAAPVTGTFVENMALASAGLVMPEGVAVYYAGAIQSAFSARAGEDGENAQSAAKQAADPEPKETEGEPPPVTQAQEAPVSTAEPSTPKQPPEGTEKGGAIKEQQYGETKETVKYKNIVVQNRTSEHSVNIEETLEKKPDLSLKNNGEPSVLIFHTHTTEAYQEYDVGWYPKEFQPRSLNSEKNMIRVGEEICKQLEAAGMGVIHDKNVYDNPSYTGAYERSGKKIDEYLEKYPSIQIILDIHRDAIEYDDGTKSKPTAVIDGKKAAQIMIISGCQEGDMTGFDDWKYNLRFALRLQQTLETDYPGLMRPLFFAPRKYNMHKSHNSLLIEMGSDGNTLEEAVYSGELLGKALAKLCDKYTQ